MTIKPPADVGREGRAFLRRMAAHFDAEHLVPDAHEVEVLHNLARNRDRTHEIRTVLPTLDTSTPEWARLARLEVTLDVEFRRGCEALKLPFGPVEEPQPKRTTTQMAQAAAAARWGHKAVS